MIDMLMCRQCVNAIRSRGEEVFTRPISFEDLEEQETFICEWCEEEYTDSELVVAEF